MRGFNTPKHIGKIWHFAKTIKASVSIGLHTVNENVFLKDITVRMGLLAFKIQEIYFDRVSKEFETL